MQIHLCPVCQSPNLIPFATLVKPIQSYNQCHSCGFIQLEAKFWPSESQERQRYEHHRNEDSPGYRIFFSNLLKELNNRLTLTTHECIRGLDYGCGPFSEKTPFLVSLLLEMGYQMDFYDPYFYPLQSELKYKFVTCTEVIEHVQSPFEFLTNISNCLQSQGILFLMTSPFPGLDQFENWSYRRDSTHISFFTFSNLKTLGHRCSLNLIHHHENLFIFQKTNKV